MLHFARSRLLVARSRPGLFAACDCVLQQLAWHASASSVVGGDGAAAGAALRCFLLQAVVLVPPLGFYGFLVSGFHGFHGTANLDFH